MIRILLIDDDELLRTTLKQMLIGSGHHVTLAADGIEAGKILSSEPFDLIIIDIIMPNRDGLETIMSVRREHPHLGILAISGGMAKPGGIGFARAAERSRSYLEMAESFGAHRTLTKPFTMEQINSAIADTFSASRPQST